MTERHKKERSEAAADVGEDPTSATQEKLRELREGLFSSRTLKPAELETTAQDLLDLGTRVGEVDE